MQNSEQFKSAENIQTKDLIWQEKFSYHFEHECGITSLYQIDENRFASGDSLGTVKIWNLDHKNSETTILPQTVGLEV